MSGSLNSTLNAEFRDLHHGGRVLAEYIWIGGSGTDIRGKTFVFYRFLSFLTSIRKVLDAVPASVDDLPVWNYDGSSTGQAPGHDSEVLIKYTIFNVGFSHNGEGLQPFSRILSAREITSLSFATPTSPSMV